MSSPDAALSSTPLTRKRKAEIILDAKQQGTQIEVLPGSGILWLSRHAYLTAAGFCARCECVLLMFMPHLACCHSMQLMQAMVQHSTLSQTSVLDIVCDPLHQGTASNTAHSKGYPREPQSRFSRRQGRIATNGGTRTAAAAA